jgi:hypothetical protein
LSPVSCLLFAAITKASVIRVRAKDFKVSEKPKRIIVYLDYSLRVYAEVRYPELMTSGQKQRHLASATL